MRVEGRGQGRRRSARGERAPHDGRGGRRQASLRRGLGAVGVCGGARARVRGRAGRRPLGGAAPAFENPATRRRGDAAATRRRDGATATPASRRRRGDAASRRRPGDAGESTSPRNTHVAAAESPRPVSTECPRRRRDPSPRNVHVAAANDAGESRRGRDRRDLEPTGRRENGGHGPLEADAPRVRRDHGGNFGSDGRGERRDHRSVHARREVPAAGCESSGQRRRRRGYSVETSRGDAAAATRTCRGDERRTAGTRWTAARAGSSRTRTTATSSHASRPWTTSRRSSASCSTPRRRGGRGISKCAGLLSRSPAWIRYLGTVFRRACLSRAGAWVDWAGGSRRPSGDRALQISAATPRSRRG